MKHIQARIPMVLLLLAAAIALLDLWLGDKYPVPGARPESLAQVQQMEFKFAYPNYLAPTILTAFAVALAGVIGFMNSRAGTIATLAASVVSVAVLWPVQRHPVAILECLAVISIWIISIDRPAPIAS